MRGSLVIISWSLVCIHISHAFDFLYKLNYHHLVSLDLDLSFGLNDLYGKS